MRTNKQSGLPEFEAKEFLGFNDNVVPGECDSLDCIAMRANRLLHEWLKGQPEVVSCDKHGGKACGLWSGREAWNKDANKTAILVGIKKIGEGE